MPGGATEFTALDIGNLSLPKTFAESPSSWFQAFWYKYTPPRDGVIGCRASLTSGTAFDPELSVFYGTPGSLDDWFFLIAQETRPATVPTIAGETLYFRVEGDTNLGGTAGVALQVAFYKAPTTASYPNGSIFIPDDTAFEYPESSGEFIAFPGAVLDPITGQVKRLQINIPACDSGDTLPDGSIILDKTVDESQVHIFSNALLPRISVTPPITPDPGGTRHHFTRYDATTWMVGTRSNVDAYAWTVDRNGVVGPDVWLISGTPVTAIAAHKVDQIVYSTSGTAIERYDIAGDAPLSNLAAGVSGYLIVRDSLIVLEDDTILAAYIKIGAPRDSFVRRYNAAGTILNTYTIGSDPLILDRICRAADSPTTFWAWIHEFIDPNETSLFQNIEIATGDVLVDVGPPPVYQSNAGIGPFLADPPKFGHSFSCPIMIIGSCACPIRPEWGGGRGFSGGVLSEGDSPMRELAAYNVMCVYGGDVPDGVDGTDTENWAD